MVALDGEDAAALGLLRRLQNYEVGAINEGNDEISGLRGEVVANPIVIGEHQKVHGWQIMPTLAQRRFMD